MPWLRTGVLVFGLGAAMVVAITPRLRGRLAVATATVALVIGLFVAEATGRPGFIVFALLAAVAADLMMGRDSVTAYQRPSTAPAGLDEG